jgi:hypothetical protein
LSNLRVRIEPLYGKSQHAFRKSASTTTALIQLSDIVTLLFDDPKIHGYAILSLDFSKAFDYVKHRILLRKTMKRLPNGFVLWLQNYLSNRSFQIRIRGHLSSSHGTTRGVPQGSILGPALFSILVGDLQDKHNDAYVIQYADDVNIIIPLETKDQSDAMNQIHAHLNEVRHWCLINGQKLNEEKSTILLQTRSTSITTNPLPVKRVASMKVLGLHINEKLTWKDHIDAMCKKACQRFHILRVLKPHVSHKELHDIYNALIKSIFDYCCPVFVKLPGNLVKCIQRVEKRAHRIIYGKDGLVTCACSLDGLTKRRERLSRDPFLKINTNKQHLLHSHMPTLLPHSTRFTNFSCRTNKRQHSFFPYTTLLINASQNQCQP